MRLGIFKSVKAVKLQKTELDKIVYMMQFLLISSTFY